MEVEPFHPLMASNKCRERWEVSSLLSKSAQEGILVLFYSSDSLLYPLYNSVVFTVFSTIDLFPNPTSGRHLVSE